MFVLRTAVSLLTPVFVTSHRRKEHLTTVVRTNSPLNTLFVFYYVILTRQVLLSSVKPVQLDTLKIMLLE